MTEYGIDFAWEQIASPAIKAAGATFVIRYLGGSARLTPVERDNHLAAGLNISLVMEQEATLAEGGFARGVTAARQAEAEADALGAPNDMALFYADDNNDAETASEVEFARGVESARKRPPGIYSGGNVCAAIKAVYPHWYTWRVETWFPGNYPNPDIEQLANTRDPIHIPGHSDDSFDTDVLFRPVPMWGPHGTTASGGDDLTPDQEKTLNIIKAALLGDGANGLYGFPEADSIGVRLANVFAHTVGIPDGPFKTVSDREQLLAAIKGVSGGGSVDPKVIADAVVAALGDKQAKAVADELARRLVA